MRRLVWLVGVGLLALSVVLAGPARPAAAAPRVFSAAAAADAYGAAATVEIGQSQFKGNWWSCEVTAYWRVSATGVYSVDGRYGCDTGLLYGNNNIWIQVAPEGCDAVAYQLGNVDEDENQGGTFSLVFPEGNCGAVTELCWRNAEQDGTDTSPPELAFQCDGWALGAPPAPPEAGSDWYNSGVAGCTAWTPLEPWVTEPQPVAVSGGWVWESVVMVKIPDYETTDTLGGYTTVPQLLVSVPGAVSLVSGDADGSVNSSPQGVPRWASANFYVNGGSASGWHGVTSRTVKVRGAVKTSAIGSEPLDFQVRGAGVVWGAGSTFGLTVGSSAGSQPEYWTVRPTVQQISEQYLRYGAHHDPERCHFWWGENMWPTQDTSGYAAPAGPVTLRDNPEPPPPSTTPTTPPPIYVGPNDPDLPAGGCPAGATCTDGPQPPAGGEDTDDSCGDGFSVTDPTSWAGAALCGVVKMLALLIEAIGELIEGILGILDGLLDLLSRLFIPTEGAFSGAIDTLRASFDGSPLGEWVAVFTPPGAGNDAPLMAKTATTSKTQTLGPMALSGPTGSCQGPTVDLGSLGLSDHLVPTEPLHPFDACSGTAATVAENVRKWTAVGLSLGAAFKIFEMLLGAFGAARTVRIMASHEWTGPGSGRI